MTEEEAIFKAQQLDMIYSQSGILHEIILDAPWLSNDPTKPKFGPHADGIVGSFQRFGTRTNQMRKFSIQSSGSGSAPADENPS